MLDHHCISFLFIESLFKTVLVSFFKIKKKSYGVVVVGIFCIPMKKQ
jgi:hypothetical protein